MSSVLYAGDPADFSVLVLRTTDEGTRDDPRFLVVTPKTTPFAPGWGESPEMAYDLALALLADHLGYEAPKPTIKRFASLLGSMNVADPLALTGKQLDSWLAVNWVLEEADAGEASWSDQMTPDEAGT